MHDYSEHQEETSPDALAKVQRAGAQMLMAQQEVERLSTELKEAQQRLKEYEEETIPQGLEDVSLQSFTLEGGVVISCESQTFGSIETYATTRTTMRIGSISRALLDGWRQAGGAAG